MMVKDVECTSIRVKNVIFVRVYEYLYKIKCEECKFGSML